MSESLYQFNELQEAILFSWFSAAYKWICLDDALSAHSRLLSNLEKSMGGGKIGG